MIDSCCLKMLQVASVARNTIRLLVLLIHTKFLVKIMEAAGPSSAAARRLPQAKSESSASVGWAAAGARWEASGPHASSFKP